LTGVTGGDRQSDVRPGECPAFWRVVTSWYNVTTMTEVGVRELKARLTEYLRRAEAGEEIAVTRRGKRVAVLRAEAKGGRVRTTEEKLLELRDRGLIQWSGKKFVPSGEPIPLRGEGPTASEMVIEDRR